MVQWLTALLYVWERLTEDDEDISLNDEHNDGIFYPLFYIFHEINKRF